jgi:hypothetical protein
VAAFVASSLYMVWRGRADLWPAIAALAAAVAVERFAPGGWGVVAAGLGGAGMGAALYRPKAVALPGLSGDGAGEGTNAGEGGGR